MKKGERQRGRELHTGKKQNKEKRRDNDGKEKERKRISYERKEAGEEKSPGHDGEKKEEENET